MPALVRPRRYLDFEVELKATSKASRRFSVSVVDSPSGSAGSGELSLPYDPNQLSRVLRQLENAVRRGGPRQEARIKTFGSLLFDRLFRGEVRDSWTASIGQIKSNRRRPRLRLKLRIDSPILAGLPWEFLFDSNRSDFLSLNRDIAIVRYSAMPEPTQSRSFSLPLYVLAAAASPKGLPRIDFQKERKLVDAAMVKLAASQQVQIRWLINPTWNELQTAVYDDHPHVFYFVGHGDFNSRRYPEGVIALTEKSGEARMVPASDLAKLVNDFALRLVVLNSCRGASGDRESLYSSTAARLVQEGVPAVLAMQFPVTEPAGAEFSSAFYRCVAAEDPIESALTEARLAMKGAYSQSLEFGSPVLYMRSKDGRLFTGRNFPSVAPPVKPAEEVNGGDEASQIHRPARKPGGVGRQALNPLEGELIKRGIVRPVLRNMALDCDEFLGMKRGQVRASIFFPDADRALRMSRQLSYNCRRFQEFRLRIKPGQGATGESFVAGRPLLTRFVRRHDPHDTLGDQKRYVHPDLRWIISVPIPTDDPAMVVSIDGLMPDGAVPSERDLKQALAGVANWIGLITREVGVVLSGRREGGETTQRKGIVAQRQGGGRDRSRRR